jgi:hypothetical protein
VQSWLALTLVVELSGQPLVPVADGGMAAVAVVPAAWARARNAAMVAGSLLTVPEGANRLVCLSVDLPGAGSTAPATVTDMTALMASARKRLRRRMLASFRTTSRWRGRKRAGVRARLRTPMASGDPQSHPPEPRAWRSASLPLPSRTGRDGPFGFWSRCGQSPT